MARPGLSEESLVLVERGDEGSPERDELLVDSAAHPSFLRLGLDVVGGRGVGVAVVVPPVSGNQLRAVGGNGLSQSVNSHRNVERTDRVQLLRFPEHWEYNIVY